MVANKGKLGAQHGFLYCLGHHDMIGREVGKGGCDVKYYKCVRVEVFTSPRPAKAV